MCRGTPASSPASAQLNSIDSIARQFDHLITHPIEQRQGQLQVPRQLLQQLLPGAGYRGCCWTAHLGLGWCRPFWPKSGCSCQRDVNWVWSYWVEQQIRTPLLWFFGDTRAAPSRPFALEFHLEWAVKNQPEIARFGLSSSGSSALLPLTPLSNPAAI